MFIGLTSFDFFSRSSIRLVLGALFTVVLIGSADVDHAAARTYQSLKPKMTERASRALHREVDDALSEPAAFQAKKSKIDAYFMTYLFPAMTSTNPKSLGELSELREDLFKDLRGAKVSAAQDHLTGLAIKAQRVIARADFHPAVRYNATLILGMLDKQYAQGEQAPVPLPEATEALVELLENESFDVKGKQVKVIPSVRAAALIGIERHARFGIASEEVAQRATKAALALIANNEPEEVVTKDVHHWMKCMAARVLSRQFAKGPTAEVQAALIGLVADKNMSLEDRCFVAELLRKIEFAGAAGLDGQAAVLALGQLAKDVAEAEAKESKEFEKEALASGPISPRGGGYGRGSTIDEGPKYPRSRLLNRLVSIALGASSLSQGMQDAEKQNLETLAAALKPVISIVADKDSLDLDVTRSVKGLKREVDNLVASWQPAAAEAADEGALDLES